MNKKLNETCFSKLTEDERGWVSEMMTGVSNLFFYDESKIISIRIGTDESEPTSIQFRLIHNGHEGNLYLELEDKDLGNGNSGSLRIQNSNSFNIYYCISEKVMTQVLQLTPLISQGKLDINFQLNSDRDGLESGFHLKNFKIEYVRDVQEDY
ncbi:hypothetical protein M2131_001550 [Polynucleobacter sphagniphilus]|jgi:hypothetical protein|uniref:hypothetical protein n=1 Tax=Polynucleobacter sphagniphilus TaxID=1743169 RepID=UPI002477122E|nr:hypothetical protein [Polynucleobacter sphagniphilus]MDH6421609.1 hypothetical protein [Polynucleobacter sphagniphilus]